MARKARKRLPPNDPGEWLNRARSSLARAKARLPDSYLEDHCFDAQQAAEKAIKAVFIGDRVTFPFIHDLGRLLTLLAAGGRRVPKYIAEADRLTRFAVEARYPGLSGPVTLREYRSAVRVAQTVVDWAARQVDALNP
jgi:HEPN domain-containing protein